MDDELAAFLKEGPEAPDPMSELEKVTRERDAYLTNLTDVQERSTAQINELRGWKEKLRALLPMVATNVDNETYDALHALGGPYADEDDLFTEGG